MEAPISASLGAMGSLLGKLDGILATEHKDEIWKLREDLAITRTLLLKLSKARDPPVTARYWMKYVRELSYDMEDCIDAETDWIDEKMPGFKTRVEELNEQYHRYMLEDSVPSCADLAIDHRLPAVDGRKAVVGLGGPIERLCQLLGDQDPELKVVSIVGVAGIGKTTLAEQLWHKLGAFQCQAFVQTSKKPDMRGILRSILSQVRPHQPPPGVSDVHNLTQEIYEHLQDKSYFVIIDDLWATSVWEVVSRAFPEGNHGSRIITTTETEDVALACCAYQSRYIFQMEPLSVQHSEELFISALFGSTAKQLDECSHEIMRRCGGLPQAIVIIASILASNRETETIENTEKAGEQWNYLQSFVLNDLAEDTPFEEMLKQVLNLCYNSLPSCLKTCLLYLSVYPENYIIFKEDFTKQWIIEGFICASTKKETMELAWSYFDKLVNMGLIRHIDVKNSDEVLSFAVNHMVHDFITSKSIEEDFVTVMDYSESTIQLSDKVRRLSLQFGSVAYATTPASTRLSQVRSLTFIGLLTCMPSISELKLLRVLILNLWGDQGSTSLDLTRISELFLLRYLQIICNVIVQLPDQMQGLEHLETFEINARPDWSLSHLRLEGGANLPDASLYPSASSTGISTSKPCYPSGPVKTFELLPPIWSLPKWIGQLNKLCTLNIVVRELLRDDISSLGGLPDLMVLSLYVRRHTAEVIVFNTGQFAALEYFEFKCGVLSLAFQEGAMPHLQMLKLGFNAHKGEQYGHFLAGIEHLSNLKEFVGIIGVAGGAEEPDWRAAESAFKDAIPQYTKLASEVKVKVADWIEEEYGSPENQHFIPEKHPPTEKPGEIKEESNEDINQNANRKSASVLPLFVHPDTKQIESINRREAKKERANNEGLVRNDDELKSTSARSVAPKRPLFLDAGDSDDGAPPGKCLQTAAPGGEQLSTHPAAAEAGSSSTGELDPELAFLNDHSKAEIVDMLRKHTYADELRQGLRRGHGGRAKPMPAWAREHLFEKAVTPSDVGKLNRLVVPTQDAERHFPLPVAGGGTDQGGVLLNFEDSEGKVWRFRYSYWNSSQSYVLTKGWSRFVQEKGLRAGDTVVFSCLTYGLEKQFFVDYRKSTTTADAANADENEIGDVAVNKDGPHIVPQSEEGEVLTKMQTAMRYNHQQQQQLASETEPPKHQPQHMISERRRREKLNDSFHALKDVLPPGSKKDKTSLLITAREYVNSLKSKVCELEEKNQALQSQVARRATSAEEDDAGKKVEIQITRAAAAEDDQTGED